MVYVVLYGSSRECGRPPIIPVGAIVSLVLWLLVAAVLVFLIVDAGMYGAGRTSYLQDRVFVVLSATTTLFALLSFFTLTEMCTHESPKPISIQPHSISKIEANG